MFNSLNVGRWTIVYMYIPGSEILLIGAALIWGKFTNCRTFPPPPTPLSIGPFEGPIGPFESCCKWFPPAHNPLTRLYCIVTSIVMYNIVDFFS